MAHEQVGLARPLLASTAQKWRAERPRTELTSWCALGRRANFVGNSHLESDCCGSTRKSASLIDERRRNQEVEHQREVDKRERERAGEEESESEARNGSGRKNWLSAGQIWPPLLFRSFSCCCCCCWAVGRRLSGSWLSRARRGCWSPGADLEIHRAWNSAASLFSSLLVLSAR